ncbi:MAG: toll/interleukin-1 receptor domain-containing protein [Planctomycetaceae bacterium]|nr:toll/interleukin-1 receptor domain-containing protein [Planctomycetaceae bacterium]
MGHDLFISYSAQDRVTAERICEGLEQSGIRCWMAPRDIVAGVSWAEAIIEAIAASKVMLLIFSNNSNASRQVLREIEYAISEDVAIVPFRIEDVPPSKAMRYFIGVPHWFDGVLPPIERHFEELTRMVRALLLRPTSGFREASQAVECDLGSWTGDEDGAAGTESKELEDLRIRIVSESDLPSPRASRQSTRSECERRLKMPALGRGLECNRESAAALSYLVGL